MATTPVFTPTIPTAPTVVSAELATAVLTTADVQLEAPAKVEEPVIKESVLLLAPTMPTNRPRPFYQQFQWNIAAGEVAGEITAVNSATGDKFEGTMEDFNDMLRGV